MVFTGSRTISSVPVALRTASTVVSGATSRRSRPSAVTSITAISVTIRFTQCWPVRGSVQRSRILGLPSLAACSMVTTTRLAPETRSMAPPIPFTIFPGIIVGQVALAVHLQRAQDREVHVAAAHHGEGVRAREVRGAGQLGHRLLARVDEVGVFLAGLRVGAHAE